DGGWCAVAWGGGVWALLLGEGGSVGALPLGAAARLAICRPCLGVGGPRLLALRTPRGLRRLVDCPQMIEAPHAASCHCKIEEHEAVDDSQLTRIQEGKEAPRRVRYEVCDRHVACQDERDRTCEQAEHDQHSADELNHAVDARERHGGHSRRGRNWQA